MVTEWIHCIAHCLQEEPHQSDWAAVTVRSTYDLRHWGTVQIARHPCILYCVSQNKILYCLIT